METKLFEVRDRMTFIPVICVKLTAANEAERYLVATTGYGLRPDEQQKYILMARLSDWIFQDSPVCHPGYPAVRTLPEAHRHVLRHWDQLTSGDVLDVEFLLGEVVEPKTSQRVEEC